MNFTLTIPQTRNFTPSELMYEYAKSTRGVFFARDRFGTSLLCRNGIWYFYDRYRIEQDTDDNIKVTVFLKEKTI